MEGNPFSELFPSQEEALTASQRVEKMTRSVSNMLSRILLVKSKCMSSYYSI